MSSGNGPIQQYAVSMSQFHQARLLQLHEQAEASGRSLRFLNAYREILGRLKRDPRVFGEQIYSLTVLKLEVRTAAIHPLIVHYGVHQERKIVFIQGFKLLD